MLFGKKLISAMTIALAICAGAYVIGEVSNAQVFAKEDYGGIIRFHVKANSDSDEDQALKLKVRDGVLEAVNEMILEETIMSYTAEDYEKFVERETIKAAQVAARNLEESEMASALNSVIDSDNSLNNEAPARLVNSDSDSSNSVTVNIVTGTAAAASTAEKSIMQVANAQLDMSEMRTLIMDNIEEIEAIAAQIIAENGYDYAVTAKLGVSRIPRKTYGDVTFPAGNYEALTIQIGEAKGENWWCVLFPPLCIIDPEGESLEAIETNAAYSGRPETSGSAFDAIGYAPTNVITLKFKTQEVLEHFGVI